MLRDGSYLMTGALKAETTLVAAGLLVSTFDFVVLLGVAVFLLTRDFFSIAIVGFSSFI
jgi:hypothetical protein